MSIGREDTKMRYRKIARDIVNGRLTSEAVINAGYSEKTAHAPSKITKRKTFQEMLDEVMPREFVLDQHKRLYSEHRNLKQIRLETLDDREIEKAVAGYENVSVIKKTDEGYTLLIINEVDPEARKEAIKLSYKLRGDFSPTKIEVKREFEDLSDDELIALLQDKLNKD